ncbi:MULTISPECIES: DNA-processing protein DprA [Nocardioides]|uniref:DNA-processing protein DprA n=1 Tax=Nocardioides TaxID=1839 RepID=UPI00032DD1BE|nr:MULTISPECIES: DNA-processing protein DprA [Nocardioides]EON23300.1 DNA protecting protein DprA [Nocardioides sp. CF8]
MSAAQELIARVRLSLAIEPGDGAVSDSVSSVGAARTVEELLDGDERPELVARLRTVDPERVLAVADRQRVRFVTPADDEWPSQLDDLAHGQRVQGLGGVPVGLWVRGPMRLTDLSESVAVVGSRSATSYGFDVATDVAASAARAGRPVVSGAAFGIDQAGHRGALAAGGATVAVLACGADRAYPAAHRELIDHIAQRHAVVSEAPPGSAPTKVRFLSRNRLIAALSRGTVLVEAALRSGALNTAHWNDQLSRVLMGVPGPVTSATSQGVHEWIRKGSAALVTSGAEVLELVGGSGEHLMAVPRGPERAHDGFSLRQVRVLDAVPVARGASTESISSIAGVGVQEADRVLVELTEAGLVHLAVDGWRLVAGGGRGGGGR